MQWALVKAVWGSVGHLADIAVFLPPIGFANEVRSISVIKEVACVPFEGNVCSSETRNCLVFSA